MSSKGGTAAAWPARLGLALLLVAGALVFGPTLRTPWLWDDHTLIRESPVLSRPELLLPSLRRDFWAISVNPREQGMYRPLITATYFADRALFGLSPVGPHAVNLALHLVAAGLLWLLARRLGAAWPEALLAAALFAFHPAVVEAIANVSSRGDLLCTALVLGGFLAWRGSGPLAGVAGAALFGLAQLAKEAAFVALPLALLLEWWAAGFTVDGRRWWRLAAPSVLVTLGVLALRGWALGSAVRLAPPEEWTPLLSGAAGVVRYAGRVVWPWPLVPYQSPTPPSLVAAAGLLGALVAAAVLRRRGRAEAVLVMAWLLVATAPVAGWLPVQVRFSGLLLYLPLTGLALFAARALDAVRPLVRWAPAVAGAVLCFALVPMWSSARALWSANVDACPELAAPRLNLANALAAEGQDDAAAQAYAGAVEAATALGDRKSRALAELGLGNLVRAKVPATAEGHFRRALEASNGALWQAALNLSVSLFQQGRGEEAAAVLEAQWAKTPVPGLASAGLSLAVERGDAPAQERWRARASGRR